MNITGFVKESMKKLGCDIAHYRPLCSDPFVVQPQLLTGRACRSIFDVGGYDGDVAALYATLFPKAEIYTFEPYPPAYERLAARFREHPRVHPVQAAISSTSGKSQFHVNVNTATNSLLATGKGAAVETSAVTNQVITVPTLTLDDFCKSCGLDAPEILKFDIQGNELQALRGSDRLLDENGPLLIYTEVLFTRLYQNCGLFGDLAGVLKTKGYELFNLYSLRHAPNGRLEYGDALFVSQRLLSD